MVESESLESELLVVVVVFARATVVVAGVSAIIEGVAGGEPVDFGDKDGLDSNSVERMLGATGVVLLDIPENV